jgi:hypothetical protein
MVWGFELGIGGHFIGSRVLSVVDSGQEETKLIN